MIPGVNDFSSDDGEAVGMLPRHVCDDLEPAQGRRRVGTRIPGVTDFSFEGASGAEGDEPAGRERAGPAARGLRAYRE